MFTIVIMFLKSFFSGLIEFFNTKLGMIVLGVIILIISLYYANNSGFNSGVEYQNKINKEQYTKQLNSVIEDYNLKQNKAIEDGINTAKKEIELNNKYKESKKVTEKISNKYKEVKMSDEDFNTFMEEVRKFK